MRWRWRLPLGCLSLIVIVMAYRILSVYEFRAGECTADPQPRVLAQTYPKRLRVMTWNIQGHASLVKPEHIDKIAETIRKVRPDIVGINEAHRNTWQSRFRDHVERLRRSTAMNAVFGESYEQLGGQFGNAILTRGRIKRHDLYKLPGAGEPRTLLKATIDIDGGTVEFYVTHLAAWEKLNRGTRENQLDCLTRHVRSSDHPYILAGDLNAPPEAPEIASFRQDNALQICGPTDATHRVMNLTIDYLFADRGWKVVSAQTLDVGPSDHRPVLAELVHD
jgi:endonuclease/exonuclease/phosphatase family metal-dependent hydrolase